jgi:hypothetical protein
MIVQVSVTVDGNKKELQGLSTDEKPTSDVGNGSSFFEIDTSECFVWHIDQWHSV